MSAMSSYPDDLLYTKDHEWARIEERDGVKVATIGITRFAVEQLGDVTQIDLPKEGETVEAGRGVRLGRVGQGGLGSVRAVLGQGVVKTNSPLGDSPGVRERGSLRRGAGWIQIALKANPDETKSLMDAESYQTFLREQAE